MTVSTTNYADKRIVSSVGDGYI